MSGCAGRELLVRFLAGDLGAAANEEIVVHVEGCPACQERLDRLSIEGLDLRDRDPSIERDDPEPAPEFLERLHDALSGASTPPDLMRFGPCRVVRPPADRDRDAEIPPLAAVPGYEILSELSRGGMGVVYKARQLGLNRLVALKMILAGGRAPAEDRARFHTEAEAVARLHHPNIVQIHDIGECDGRLYFSMELVDGPTLAGACRGRPQPARDSAALVEILARAIHCAHQRGILHRDLKPANVLLQPIGAGVAGAGDDRADGDRDAPPALSSSAWTPKLVDFGLAKRLDDVSLTQHGQILGTPSYMAPEQVTERGRALDAGVDVYALGAILYELLTGRPPFLARSIESTLALVVYEDPILPRRLQPDVPRDLETIGLKCLEKDPARRYATAEELADDLGRFGRGEPVRARPPSTFERGVKLARRHSTAVAGVSGVIAALALGFATTGIMAVRESRARRLADGNAERAQAAAREANEARAEALRQAYQARLAASMAATSTHDMREAARQLELAPPERRGWEWRHIRAGLDDSLATVAGLPPLGGVAFCPPGERLVVADPRGCGLLDAATGELLTLRITGPPCHHVSAFMTPRGPRVVLDQSTETLSLALIDGEGRVLGRIARPERYSPGEKPSPLAIAMSRDGRRLALQALRYGTPPLIEVFDVASGRRTAAGGDRGYRLLALEFSPDGRRLAAVLESSQLFLFDAATVDRVATFWGHVGPIAGVAYSPDGERLATCGHDQTIRVWDAATGRTLHVLRGHTGPVLCVAFSQDGREIASGGSDGTVRLWSPGGGDGVLVCRGHTAPVSRVAFGTDGRTIASLARDGTARLWDATARYDPRVLRGHTSYVYPVAYSPDGRRIASGAWDGTVRVWDAASGRLAHTLRGHVQPVGTLAFTPDGARLASWGEDRTIRLWDTTTGEEIEPRLSHESMPHRDSVYSLVITPDGRRIGAVVDDGVRFWDLETREERAALHLSIRGVRVAALSPDGRHLAAAGDAPKAVVVVATSGAPVAELTGFRGRLQSIAFSPDGRQVLTAGKDATLRLWDAATGRLVRTFAGHGLEVLSAVFHPDGTRIASGGHDRSIRIWDVATGEELVQLPGHSSYVFSLAFSPDGETLVSGSGDGTVRLWDTFPVARRLRARRAAPATALAGPVDTPSSRLGSPKGLNPSHGEP